MNNGPGVSLFQSTEVLQLNTSAEREEEEEALEDAKRRNEELQNLLTNAFDDLIDDDDDGQSTLNSSHCDASSNGEGLGDKDKQDFSDDMSYSGHMPLQPLGQGNGKLSDNVCNLFKDKFIHSSDKENWQQNNVDVMNVKGSPAHQQKYYNNVDSFSKIDTQEAYRQAEYNSVDQMQVLYEVRLREIKRLTEQIEKEQKDAAEYKDQMFRKLALCEAEKERAILSRTQAHELLVKSKGEISELQKEVATLNQNVTSLEKTKSELTKELSISRLTINELQQKLTMIERCDVQKNMEKEMDSVMKDLKNKHQQEISNLQRQIEFTTAKYNQKENDCSLLEQKVSELQRAQEALLVEKSDTINQLARSLEESQAQCRQLMASNVSCDNIRLQTMLDEAVHEKKELQQALKSIQTECDMLRSDVAQYESITKLSLPEDNSSDETDSIVHLGISQKSTSRRSSNMNLTDIGSKLKNELHRAVLNQKAKRMEIYKLQEMLNAKEKQIQDMKKQERIYHAETEGLKETLSNMMDQLKMQRDEENRKENITDKISKEEVDRLNARILQLQKEKQELEKNKEDLETKNKILKDELEALSQRIEEEKRRALEDYNKQYMEFHKDTVAKLKKEMDESSDRRVNECREKLEEALKELDEVKRLYVEVSKTREQLSQELKCGKENTDKVVKEKEDLMAELTKVTTTRDQLAKKVQTTKQENDELNVRLKNLQEELAKNDITLTVIKLTKESDDLRQEISRMSDLHADELSKVRNELQAARERLVKLEKNLRVQLETEMVKVRSEKEELRVQYEDRENNLKRIIEAQKRRPILRDIGTEMTDIGRSDISNTPSDCEERIKEIEEEHKKVLLSYQERINSLINDHKEELNKAEEKINSLQDNHRQVLEAIREKIVEEGDNLKLKHASELALIEEKTKDMAVKYFTEQFRKLEAQFEERLEEAKRNPDIQEGLQEALVEKVDEVDMLKNALSKTYQECEKKVADLHKQIDEDRSKMSEVMNHWAQEAKIIKLQLSEKDKTIEELRGKLKSLRTTAKAYRNQLTGSRNSLIAAQAKMESILTEKEKEVDVRIEEIEKQYEKKEKELRNKINRRPHT